MGSNHELLADREREHAAAPQQRRHLLGAELPDRFLLPAPLLSVSDRVAKGGKMKERHWRGKEGRGAEKGRDLWGTVRV